MKAKVLFASALAALMLTACGFTQSATTSSSTSSAASTAAVDGQTIGKSTGNALDYLAAQYKSAGKIDMTNMMNVAQVLNVVGGAQQVYSNKSDSDYRKSFAKGLVAGSLNIDTEAEAQSITERLEAMADQTNLTELQSAMQKGQATATEVENVANSVTNIINTFKK